jgi:predicted RND superfamily exporter protein
LSTLYGAQEPTNLFRSSTLAAQIGVELGRPALWILMVLAGVIVFTCARASFHRGRDFFYPLAGAGVGVAMILTAFSDAGLANLATSILVAVTLGLSFAQSISRSL